MPLKNFLWLFLSFIMLSSVLSFDVASGRDGWITYCTDTDGGNNPLVAGTCSSLSGSVSDYCYGINVIEYYCTAYYGGSCVYTNVNCLTLCQSYGPGYTGTCSGGACVCTLVNPCAGKPDNTPCDTNKICCSQTCVSAACSSDANCGSITCSYASRSCSRPKCSNPGTCSASCTFYDTCDYCSNCPGTCGDGVCNCGEAPATCDKDCFVSATSLAIYPGWNLISADILKITRVTEDQCGMSSKYFYYLNRVANAWDKNLWQQLEGGKGYWVYSDASSDCTMSFGGSDAVKVSNIPPLKSGYNLIGTPSSPSTNITSIKGNCNITIGPLYWKTSSQSWEKALFLEAKKGYWLYADKDCQLS